MKEEKLTRGPALPWEGGLLDVPVTVVLEVGDKYEA